jgi:hypothetical protein
LVRFGQQFDPKKNTITIAVTAVPELPIHWTLTAADALQNFRTALNYLAWELAKWNLHRQGEQRGPGSRTEFPIGTEPARFPRYKVADLHPDHVAAIENLQPYEQGYIQAFHGQPVWAITRENGLPGPWAFAIAEHPLALLQRLSNHDKHRLLQLVGMGVDAIASGPGIGPPDEFIDCHPIGTSVYDLRALKPGAEWKKFRVNPTGPNPRVNVNDGAFSTAAAFEDGRLVEDTLDRIGVTVVQIIRRFEPVF